MSSRTRNFQIGGQKYTFEVVAGAVLDTDQRSDTHVFGSGKTVVLEGSGGGNFSVGSRVDIVRDIWLKEDDGQEAHVRLFHDVPVRTGQRIYHTSLSGPELLRSQGTIDFSLYNCDVDRIWSLHGKPFVGSTGLLYVGAVLVIGSALAAFVNPTWILLCLLTLAFLIWNGIRFSSIQKKILAVHDELTSEFNDASPEPEPDHVPLAQ